MPGLHLACVAHRLLLTCRRPGLLQKDANLADAMLTADLATMQKTLVQAQPLLSIRRFTSGFV